MKKLKDVNNHIKTKYPLLEVTEDDYGGLYLYSDNQKTSLALAALYSSALDIHISALNHWTFDEIMQTVDQVLADKFRFGFDRIPVKFEYYISQVTVETRVTADKSEDFNEAIRMMAAQCAFASDVAIRKGLSSTVMIICNDEFIKVVEIVNSK